MQPFTAPPHHNVLVLLVQLGILLFTARVLGEIASRLKQPIVVGEILAGILLGPSFLSTAMPFLSEWIVPHSQLQGYLLETISLVAVLFLMLLTGLETDIPLMRRQLRSAVGVAVGGLVLPLILGYLLGETLPDYLLVNPAQRSIFSLFLATAMSISAIPVIAKVLLDLNLTRRDIGQVIIASAMIDDTTGWVLLSVVVGLVGGATVSVGTIAQSIFSVLGFMVISFTLGRWLIRWALRVVQNKVMLPNRVLSVVILFTFVWGAISLALGLEALLGAFIVGILLGQIPSLPSEVIHTIERLTLGVFAPIFFAIAGLKVNVLALLNPDRLWVAVVVILVATIGKIVGVYVGARMIAKQDHWTAVFYGAGLNARGSMEIIIATIGLNAGVLTQDMFSVIVVMAVSTSLMAPFVLRWALQHIPLSKEEAERLHREELLRDNLIANVHRVLLPVRPREDVGIIQTVESRILTQLSQKTDLQVTVMSVTEDETHPENLAWLNHFVLNATKTLTINKRIVVADRPATQILNEARREYDLMIIGSPEGKASSEVLFTPITDYLVRLSPCPVVIVSGRPIEASWVPRRILVPTNGSYASRRGAELAFALASDTTEVAILRVVERNLTTNYLESGTLIVRQMTIARQTVDELVALGDLAGIATLGDIQIGTEPEKNIVDYANLKQVDLIVLGTSVRSGSDKLYLGPRVERILRDAPCPVLVINA